MKCFACDRTLTTPELDIPTTRYYCYECLQPAFEEMLRSDKADRYILENSPLVDTDLEKFFDNASSEDTQEVLEAIWNGEYDD